MTPAFSSRRMASSPDFRPPPDPFQTPSNTYRNHSHTLLTLVACVSIAQNSRTDLGRHACRLKTVAGRTMFIINRVLDAIFIIDMIITFNSAVLGALLPQTLRNGFSLFRGTDGRWSPAIYSVCAADAQSMRLASSALMGMRFASRRKPWWSLLHHGPAWHRPQLPAGLVCYRFHLMPALRPRDCDFFEPPGGQNMLPACIYAPPPFYRRPDCLNPPARAAFACRPPQDLYFLKLVRIIRLIKLLRLIRNNLVVEAMESQIAVDYGGVQLVKYLLVLVFLTHWLACGWCVSLPRCHTFTTSAIVRAESVLSAARPCSVIPSAHARSRRHMIIDLESADDCMLYIPAGSAPTEWECCYNWLSCAHGELNFNPTQAESLARKYVLSITWSSGEVFTTGSQIHPVTMVESCYKLVAQAVCGIMYAYLLGALCNIFAQKERDSNRYYEDMDVLNGVLTTKRVDNQELSSSLRAFFR
jgi:hypothetical protein